MTFGRYLKALRKERTHGWTAQKSRCGFAMWWDCNFWCSNPELNPDGKIVDCICVKGCLGEPDFERCKKIRRS